MTEMAGIEKPLSQPAADLNALAARAQDAAERLGTPEAGRAAAFAPGAAAHSRRVLLYLELAQTLARRLEPAWDALDGTGDDLRKALNVDTGRSLADVIQCPNCWQVVRLPEPIRVPHSGELNAFQRTWVPPRVPAHGCAHCTGGWDCPRDINWEEAGMRGPCTEEHEDVDGPLVIGFPQ